MKTLTSLLKFPAKAPGFISRYRAKSRIYNREACSSCILKIKYEKELEKVILDQLNFI